MDHHLSGYQPQLALAKSVTPATDAPYHGAVTYTLAPEYRPGERHRRSD
jgi:hypothetical protein